MYDENDLIITKTYKNGKKRILTQKICDVCGKKLGYFLAKKIIVLNYCKKCQYEKNSRTLNKQIIGNCQVCKKVISRNKSQWERAKIHTCSNKCLGKFKRKKINEVGRSKLKIKMVQENVPAVCVKCGHDHFWNLQAHHKKFMINGGKSTLDNLEFQCRNCHGDTHFEKKDGME